MDNIKCLYCNKELDDIVYIANINGSLGVICLSCRNKWGHNDAKRIRMRNVKEWQEQKQAEDQGWQLPKEGEPSRTSSDRSQCVMKRGASESKTVVHASDGMQILGSPLRTPSRICSPSTTARHRPDLSRAPWEYCTSLFQTLRGPWATRRPVVLPNCP